MKKIKRYNIKDMLWLVRLVCIRFNHPYVAHRIIIVSKISQSGFGFIERRKAPRFPYN